MFNFFRGLLLFVSVSVLNSESVFNCPAPRSPENGLSFIFEDGGVVRFRCHPGFVLIGRAEANCLDTRWNSQPPECRPDSDDVDVITKTALKKETRDSDRSLFAWNADEVGEDLYGAGPRRLPLINGLWNPATRGKVVALTSNPPQQQGSSRFSSRAGNDLLQQELGIAEIRHKQQQEVREHHPPRRNEMTWRQRQIERALNQPTILYQSGSRSASAYRGNPEISNSIPLLEPLPTSRPTPAFTPSNRRLNDPDLVELRRRQIEQTLRERMNAIHPSTSHNADKSGLVEDARRRQFEIAQSFRRPQEPSGKEESNRRAIVASSPGVLFSIGEVTDRQPLLRQFPRTTTTPQPESERPTRRPELRPPPITTRSSEKGGVTREALYEQYLQAQHMKNIMDYEIALLNADSNRRGHRSSSMSQSSSPTIDSSPNLLSNVDMEWLRTLAPDLQERYLRDVLTSRMKESRESQYSGQFLKRHLDNELETFPSQTSRNSASGTVTVIQGQPASPNASVSKIENWKNFDLSCNKQQNRQRLFIRAPKVKNAFVHRYERKKNPAEPFNTFLIAEYRCRKGYRFVEASQAILFCQRMQWIGILPRCLAGSG